MTRGDTRSMRQQEQAERAAAAADTRSQLQPHHPQHQQQFPKRKLDPAKRVVQSALASFCSPAAKAKRPRRVTRRVSGEKVLACLDIESAFRGSVNVTGTGSRGFELRILSPARFVVWVSRAALFALKDSTAPSCIFTLHPLMSLGCRRRLRGERDGSHN